MLESQGMQHIFIMSSTVEKVQQVLSHRVENQAKQMSDSEIQLYEQKKIEVQDPDKAEDPAIFEKESESKKKSKGNRPQKKDIREKKDFDSEDMDEYTQQGTIINIII